MSHLLLMWNGKEVFYVIVMIVILGILLLGCPPPSDTLRCGAERVERIEER